MTLNRELSTVDFVTTSKRNPIYGFSFPTSVGLGGSFTKSEGLSAIKAGLIQLLLTSRGERVMRPGFGCSLRGNIFEPNDTSTLTDIRRSIIETIAAYEDRAVVHSLQVTSDPKDISDSRIKISLAIALKNDLATIQTLEVIV